MIRVGVEAVACWKITMAGRLLVQKSRGNVPRQRVTGARGAGRLFGFLVMLAIGSGWALPAVATPRLHSQPFHQSPVAVAPGELLMLPGYDLAADDVVVYRAVSAAVGSTGPPASIPAANTRESGVAPIVSSADAPHSLVVRWPEEAESGRAYAVWIRAGDGRWSNHTTVNDARPLWVTPSYAYESATHARLPRYLKVVGRNLDAAP